MYNTYMISYDLNSPSSNRKEVEESIKSLGSWCKYVSTTFLVSSYKNINEVQSIATKYLDSNDSMVICLVQKPIKGWLSQEQWNWISQNI